MTPYGLFHISMNIYFMGSMFGNGAPSKKKVTDNLSVSHIHYRPFRFLASQWSQVQTMKPFDSRGIFKICLYAFNQIPEAHGRVEQDHNLFHLKAGSNWLIGSTGKIPVSRSLVGDVITIQEISYTMDKRETIGPELKLARLRLKIRPTLALLSAILCASFN